MLIKLELSKKDVEICIRDYLLKTYGIHIRYDVKMNFSIIAPAHILYSGELVSVSTEAEVEKKDDDGRQVRGS